MEFMRKSNSEGHRFYILRITKTACSPSYSQRIHVRLACETVEQMLAVDSSK